MKKIDFGSLERGSISRSEMVSIKAGSGMGAYCGCACSDGYMGENAIDNGAENAEVGLHDGRDFECICPGFVIDDDRED